MKNLFWILTIIGGFIGGIILFVGLMGSSGAPQQAAAAGMAIAFVAIPYCMARAFGELSAKVFVKPSEPVTTSAGVTG